MSKSRLIKLTSYTDYPRVKDKGVHHEKDKANSRITTVSANVKTKRKDVATIFSRQTHSTTR